LALGIALTFYGSEEEADIAIEQMTRDQDPILRYGGMYALALAEGLLFWPLDSFCTLNQSALIAMAMVMIQTSEASDSRVRAF
nr:26S proteasome non-ATPase regulatory subunit 1 homolog A-like [Tanacetum cinerariifolium]